MSTQYLNNISYLRKNGWRYVGTRFKYGKCELWCSDLKEMNGDTLVRIAENMMKVWKECNYILSEDDRINIQKAHQQLYEQELKDIEGAIATIKNSKKYKEFNK